MTSWLSPFPKGNIFCALYARIAPGNRSSAHRHDFAEVFWVRQGVGQHIVNGQPQTVRTGDLVMIRPIRDGHKFLSQSPDFTIANVSFPTAMLADIKRRYFDSYAFWGGSGKQPELYHLTETERQWLNAAAESLIHAPQDRLLLDRFLLNLLSSTGRGQPDPLRACPDWLRTAAEAIRRPEHFAGGVRALVTLTRRSPEHVARTLKKYSGKSPSEWVNSVRMEYAAGQLLTTDRAIQEISLDCGLNSLSHFYMLFHKAYRMSPRRYRLTFFKAPAQMMLPDNGPRR